MLRLQDVLSLLTNMFRNQEECIGRTSYSGSLLANKHCNGSWESKSLEIQKNNKAKRPRDLSAKLFFFTPGLRPPNFYDQENG